MHFQYDGTWMICLYCGGELGWSCDCFEGLLGCAQRAPNWEPKAGSDHYRQGPCMSIMVRKAKQVKNLWP
jgi:hypothetical protein